jgi:hypothetical protein
MEELSIQPHSERHCDDIGCAYIFDDNSQRQACGAPRRLNSSYCPQHHALCHVSCGSSEGLRRLREVEALANAVGGRRARDGGEPPQRFLRRLEHAVRDFS